MRQTRVDYEYIVKLRQDKCLSIKEIADEVGYTYSHVWDILQKFDIPRLTTRNDSHDLWEDPDRVISLRYDGWTLKEIANYLDCSVTLVWNILKKFNVDCPNVKKYRHQLWQDSDKVMELRDKGWTLKKIADHFDCSVSLIHEIETTERENRINALLGG